ncbi:hypothetical protein [Lignipirellula cremea]|nr:hypothetical protein [Lignipirellula cremea]
MGVLLFSIAGAPGLSAQTFEAGSRALVVVVSAQDADLVRQIGGTQVDVRQLCVTESDRKAGGYAACNACALQVRHFTLYLARAEAYSPTEGFWRERLTQTNPHGHVHWIAQDRNAAEQDRLHPGRQATAVHQALVSVLPQHRAYLDGNLQSALIRLRRLRPNAAQFASGM